MLEFTVIVSSTQKPSPIAKMTDGSGRSQAELVRYALSQGLLEEAREP